MAIEPNPTLPAAAQQAPVEQDARERLDNASVGSGSASRGGPDMSKGPIAVFNVPKEKQEQEHQRHDNEAAAGVATEIAPAMPYISSSPGPSSGEQSGAEVDAEQQATVGEFPGRRAGLSSTLPLAAGELPPPPTIAGIRLHEEPDATGKGVPSSAGVVAVGAGAGDGGGNEQGRESSDSENMNAKQSDAMRNVLNLPDLIITLQDVSYWIPTPRRSLKELMSRKKKPSSGQVVPERPKRIYLLNHITGTIRPKQMTMLMGKSGAGKSTLLDVIAGRKTFGTVEGTLLFNGQPRPHNFRRLCGYVEQTDTLMPTLTPREHFYYTARLRLPSSLEKDEIDDHVSSVVAKLGLQGCADTVVGGLRHRGISGGEAKRVNIGLELITSPTVLFLDEPSSGLDATTAFDIMRVVRKICDDGTGVLCTLHQPSREIWELFHNLVLLSTGGVAFFGPTNLAVPYFTRLGFECLPGKNPAEFVLDVLNSTTPTGYTSVRGPHVDDEFFLKQYTDSRMAEERNYSALATAEQAAAEAAALSEKDLNETFPLFQNSAQHNMKVLLQRSGVRLRRDSNFYVNRLIVPTIVALILLLLYLDSPYDMSGIRNRQSIIMLTVTFFLIGTNSLISLCKA
ncbi:hypothetical protein, variant [Capsaspora owczarzaki ATCC 30864]|uniref:ABC transporter domain-containing protein n=1 Tax=Capsaspora owczarzaki (strain ATCC 30864) TaxID=595528 RepID=A0A0D2WM86_CAPO3|nr:hypothetical protein, variant [Capsaspora owczarzaki ATCC 30864]